MHKLVDGVLVSYSVAVRSIIKSRTAVRMYASMHTGHSGIEIAEELLVLRL